MSVDYKYYLEQLAVAERHHSALSTDQKPTVERLLDQLESHERSERNLLEDYRLAAEKSRDRGVRFLMGLILEDEERHHRLMSAMANDLKSSVLWLGTASSLPSIGSVAKHDAELVAQTERFLKIEEESADQLKELKKAVKDLHSGLTEVIVESMEADTHKHIDLLKYIRKQLESR